ncbi:ejaculatory bulb-specific protein 3-like [Macrosteles quadrilineatus]|uniref:ejaculatory bulb-specific protein 3-like n=1 Tax=Macrosteles quadrilineatus TaxID=74068 RepID=UPI0023E10996|nr:ejaculatory bulb-specific protein 3-like [Macrosteles quadrilineatus]
MLLPLILILLSGCAAPQKTRDPAKRALYRLEKIDVDNMLNNNRIMTNYVKCFVGKGACSPEARDFRKLIPKLTATACGDCTPNQKKIIKKIFLFMYFERSSDWKVLQERYDPNRKFEAKVCEFMGIEKDKKTVSEMSTNVTKTEEKT